MTKSRTTLAFLLVFTSVPALAQPIETITAERALESYRNNIPSVDELDCPRGKDEVVICAQRGTYNKLRLPLPVEPEPGRVTADNRFTTDRLMRLDAEQACVSNTGCGEAGIPILPIIFFVFDKAVKAARGEDLSSP